jgi:hypothetical protein
MTSLPEMSLGILGLSDTQQTTVLIAALTALATSLITLPLKWFLGARLNRNRERTKWEFEQRRELRRKIGQFHGRLLEAASSFNYRLVNLDENWQEGWHKAGGIFDLPPDRLHYLRTLAYRFVVLQGLVTRFQHEVMFIDSRIGKREDRTFLFYLKALEWTMTNVKLFSELDYDLSTTSAHFFTDQLRRISSAAWCDGEPVPWDDFVATSRVDGEWTPILLFFDNIEPGELRWDRLRAYRLVLMCFINSFGYREQRSQRKWLRAVAQGIEHPEVAANLYLWLPKFGLRRQRWIRVLRRALKKRARESEAGRALLGNPIGMV